MLKRKAHVIKDIDSRLLKAKKIQSLLELDSKPQKKLSLLDIGTGSGVIAHYFSHLDDGAFSVTAADVEDNRVLTDGYDFHRLSGTRLPFEENKFDIVITNHVIEHVGDETEQISHLNEIRRTLKADGIVYLAVPNRWMLIEPHYQLAFLSWLPRKLRSHYLRWRRGIPFYDCEPLSLGNLQKLLDQTGFYYQNKTVSALLLTLQLEYPKKSFLRLFFSYLPIRIIEFLKPVIPTLIFRLTKTKLS